MFRCFFSVAGYEPMVRLAAEAAAEVEQRSFDVCFDRAVSFRAKPGNYLFVLAGDNGLEQLKSFRRRLGAVPARKALRRLASREFTPHVTLPYGERRAEEHPIEAIRWTIKEFRLIHRLNGHFRVWS